MAAFPAQDPLIEDYALIGNAHGAALIHRSGTIEWLCMPRFDSEAIMASLLGTPDNGCWVLRAADAKARVSRRYVPDTMVLETTIETADGAAVILDFMPPPAENGQTHELVRIVRGASGTIKLFTEIRIRCGYGRYAPWTERREGAVWCSAGPDGLRLSSSIDLTNPDYTTSAELTLSEGQEVHATLEWFPSHITPGLPRDPAALLRHTIAQERQWISRCACPGPYEDTVRRSLLVLKALTYHPTGGIVAAPTTSLPEEPGGVRNWDYRYCWIRDAVWTLHALVMSGYSEEAHAWLLWLMRATAGSPDELQIMYGLHGERRLIEDELTHLAGFGGAKPVRVGNGAYDQIQLDIYGSLLGAFDMARRDGLPDMDLTWPFQKAVANRVMSVWKEKDSGLWEVRSGLQHFTYSKIMCWFALNRTIASARDFGLEGNIDAWTRVRDEIHADVCEKGFNAEINSFVQYYGADRVDASLLQISLLGFLPSSDPRVKGTVKRIEEQLRKNGFVWRYLADSEEADGLPGEEGAFLACSFWLCDAWILEGRTEEARVYFEKLTGCANDLGLMAEEYDPASRRQLGNFPQAFSHFALVQTAHLLNMQQAGGTAPDEPPGLL
ncbi:glycoside hydrolase family 15 protein [Acetobacter sp. AN02]|uniref:glycoside hydrolase family 15 protein n=1 Tax=Acetobacter sp. AN02 TaxID=2894186 RepID=UPI00243435C9|nr:glycoside hydrolase family 15 protein [Acetobacter sp. AN02]MDG6095484.1 glycoside hydrolase family 15 protein [Acetobacter sp. AN02]